MHDDVWHICQPWSYRCGLFALLVAVLCKLLKNNGFFICLVARWQVCGRYPADKCPWPLLRPRMTLRHRAEQAAAAPILVPAALPALLLTPQLRCLLSRSSDNKWQATDKPL
nr:hypothetical protein [Variovorax boronicumulans]